jgi:hypothetical protein
MPSDGAAPENAAVTAHQPRLYFAYGSMCNPVSLNRRGLFPTASSPAQLQGYRLAFQLGASCHTQHTLPAARGALDQPAEQLGADSSTTGS